MNSDYKAMIQDLVNQLTGFGLDFSEVTLNGFEMTTRLENEFGTAEAADFSACFLKTVRKLADSPIKKGILASQYARLGELRIRADLKGVSKAFKRALRYARKAWKSDPQNLIMLQLYGQIVKDLLSYQLSINKTDIKTCQMALKYLLQTRATILEEEKLELFSVYDEVIHLLNQLFQQNGLKDYLLSDPLIKTVEEQPTYQKTKALADQLEKKGKFKAALQACEQAYELFIKEGLKENRFDEGYDLLIDIIQLALHLQENDLFEKYRDELTLHYLSKEQLSEIIEKVEKALLDQ